MYILNLGMLEADESWFVVFLFVLLSLVVTYLTLTS